VHARPGREAGRYLGVGIGVRDMHAPVFIMERRNPLLYRLLVSYSYRYDDSKRITVPH
jgi:hypothetical protein